MIRVTTKLFTAVLLCGFLSSIAVCQQQNDGHVRYRTYAKGLIGHYDLDKDGMLSTEEVNKMRRPPTNADANKDGFLTEDELVGAIAGRSTTKNQDPDPSDDPSSSSSNQASLIVQLTEYRLKLPHDPSRSVSEILAILAKPGDNEEYQPIETIRMSALSGTESTVQFGRRVNVTVGTVTNRGGTARNVQAVDIGTLVKVTPALQSGGRVALKLKFESSRIEGDASADSPPDISRTQINTTQVLELGKPSLVGSTTSTASSIILITVTGN